MGRRLAAVDPALCRPSTVTQCIDRIQQDPRQLSVCPLGTNKTNPSYPDITSGTPVKTTWNDHHKAIVQTYSVLYAIQSRSLLPCITEQNGNFFWSFNQRQISFLHILCFLTCCYVFWCYVVWHSRFENVLCCDVDIKWHLRSVTVYGVWRRTLCNAYVL